MAENNKVLCNNKHAYHDYFITDTIKAGMVLVGTEIKSMRLGKSSFNNSYCDIIDGEMFLVGYHISEYDFGNIFNHDPDRKKKLLLNKREIIKFQTKKEKDGYTIIPLQVFLENGKAKITIALAKGKKLYDKREQLKEDDQKRYIEKTKGF